MAKMNFTRSNVNERTLSISAPLRSSFDLSESDNITLPMGRLIPVHTQRFMPSSIVKGKFNLNLQMEKIAAPTLGRLRLDTHAFIVYDNRVNRDIKQFINQDLAGTITMPSFSYWATMGRLFAAICGISAVDSLRESLWEYSASKDPSTQPAWNIAISKVYHAAIENYENKGTDTTSEHMYMKDFYLLEAARLTELKESFDKYYTAEGKLQYSLTRAIYEIMRPYNGAGSLLEMLGYPKWSLFSSEFDFLTHGDWKMNTGSSDASPWDFEISPVSMFTSNYDGNTGYITEQVVSEMLLRKVYSVWYDYFRDYQIEKRTEILDPDLWDSTSLLNANTNLDELAMLLIPKYRYYGRDMLTTTQVDDIWRHVYAPIFGDSDSFGTVVSNSSSDEHLQNALNLISLSDNQFDVFFPVGVLGGTAEFDVLKHDLQVQRRAGMLEKYLARKFFNADTYTGVLEAHYGVKPEDYQLSTAQYLGGSESMINGEQSVATMDTGFTGADGKFTGTPRGTRTLNAGGANGCEFSYRVGGNFADIITFASLMPMVKYDAANMHLKEIHFTDMPLPEFAQDSRVEIRSSDYLRGFDYDQKTLGFVPRYMAYRGALDKIHGDYLEGKRSYQFFRDWYNITNNIAETLEPSGDYFHTFGLNPYSLRVHLRPEAFLGLQEWSHICYGDADMQLFVDCPLPAAVDFI